MSRRLEAESTAWFDAAIDLNCIASADGYFVRVNEAFETTLGYSKDQLLSRPFIDFVHPDDRDTTIAETIKLAERLGNTADFENRYRAADGTYHWLQWSATPRPTGGSTPRHATSRSRRSSSSSYENRRPRIR